MLTVLTCFRIAFVSCDEVNLDCSLLVMASLYKKCNHMLHIHVHNIIILMKIL